MMRSAPSRSAARTESRPTAPSPMTVTVVRGLTPAMAAAWWPVPRTSVRVSRWGSRAESGATGELDEGAVGQRDAYGLGLAARVGDHVPERGLGVAAGSLQALATVPAGAVGDGEGRDDQVALLDGAHLAAGVLDDAEEFVSDAERGVLGGA